MRTYEITYIDGSTERVDATATLSKESTIDFFDPDALVLSVSRAAYRSVRDVTGEAETAAILDDPDTMPALAEAEADLAAGRVTEGVE